MNYFLELQKIYFYILVWGFRIAWYLGFHNPKRIETFMDIERQYTEQLKVKFSLSFSNVLVNYNENIDPIFYDKKTYNSYMQESNTELERIWRTRILFEKTPRGNVLFFYDAFKMGFSFYSDEKSFSYDILNSVAMKYVTLYRCRDFFIDESVVHKEQCSPFIKLYFTEEPKKNGEPMKNNPFAKTRRENPNSKNTKEIKMKEPEKMKNKFLYLGKMNNAFFLQSVPKKRKVLAKFISPLLENIKLESGITRETLSYKDYKISLTKSPEDTIK